MLSPPLPDILPINIPKDLPAGAGIELPRPPIVFPPPWFPRLKFLNSGAWLVNYEPNSSQYDYDGTIRIENHSGGRTASGDLYQRPGFWIPGLPLPFPRPRVWFPLPPPNPANGIPIQSRANYRYYLRITKIDEFLSFGNTFELGIQMHKYAGTDKNNFNFTKEPADSDYTATMTWTTAPAGYPNPGDYAEGDVKLDRTGAVVGRLKMGRVSDLYRKFTVEIDNVSGSEQPLDNGVVGAGREDWGTVFSRVGFNVRVVLSDTNIPEPSGDSWSRVEGHQTMLAKRDLINLDTEWRYYILATKLNDDKAYGVMFDNGASDSNNIPREGLMVSSHVMTDSNPNWGTEQNKRFGTVKRAYFRTALHELGHAFGLRHNDDGNDGEPPVFDFSFMNQTRNALDHSTPANPFPTNIKWNHADRNLFQLRHWPDVFIRPGGVEFGLATNSKPPITPVDTDREFEVPDLVLSVKPIQDQAEVPLGAPVRVDITLTNMGKDDIPVPSDISLKSDHISGTVTDVAGMTRSFQPLFCLDRPEEFTVLKPGRSVSASLTLLRGGQGALFPMTGVSRITVKLSWSVGTGTPLAIVIGSVTVMVTPPLDKSHAAAAHKLLTTPDAHLVLVLGGDHLVDGVKAIQQALDDETLRPHFAFIEAKRRAKKFFDRAPDLKGASKLVCESEVVMSDVEKAKLEKLGVTFG